MGRVGMYLVAVALAATLAHAQPSATLPALLLSDIHFDPFRDPGKVARLAAAPVGEWQQILASAASPDRAEKYAALEAACHSRGEDSDFALFQSSLKAEKAVLLKPAFVTITGDLLGHQFDCRYAAVMKSDKGYSAFASKTASFVIQRVEQTYPGTPVYVGMGNNDSGCGDYKMDPHDPYFAGTADAIVKGLAGAPEASQARKDYESGGFYSALLPGMSTPTRLLVLDDIFLSRGYGTCAGKPDQAGARQMMAWLTAQLESSRQHAENVWVMGHIPPGVNVYSTLKKGDPCSGSADTFLSAVGPTTLGATIAGASDIVKLALFGHTHMDEIRLLKIPGTPGPGVPMKGVASITPVNGNRPSFTIADIDSSSSTLSDYSVYVSSSRAGDGTWPREYTFRQTYSAASFTGAALESITQGFRADPAAETPHSAAYERYFDAGFPISPLVFGWEPYVCGIDHLTPDAYKACACTPPTATK
jgi:sphingomyelin phosphodiesterase acid-like 3